MVGFLKKRRAALFKKTPLKHGRVSVSVNNALGPGPDLVLQVHSPENKIKQAHNSKHKPVGISFSGKLEREIPF